MSKKKQQTLEELLEEALVPEEEWPYEVPGNWIWVTSDSVLKFIGGGTPSKSVPGYWRGNIPWATVKDIKLRFLNQTIDFITEEGFNNSSASIAEPNDLLLITRISPGKCTITNIRTSINQDLKIVRPKVEILPYFLWLYFSNNKPLIESMSTGTTVKGIQVEKLKKLPFSLPPVEEQKRIIDRVERLLSKIDEAKQLIEAAKETFELRQAAILDKAFRGELTENWRKSQKNKSVLKELQSVKERRDDEEDNLKKKKNWKSSLFNYSIERDVKIDEELPSNWVVAPVGLLCECIVPGRDKPKSFTGDIPWVKIPDVKTDLIVSSLTGEGLTGEEIQEVNAKIIPANSVIMSCIGRFGISAVVGKPIVINQQLHAFLESEVILPEYLMYHIRILTNYMNSIATSTTISYLNKSNANSLPINLAPIPEQRVIVEKIDDLLGKENQAAEFLVKTTNHLDDLKQSILSKAFKGELGTNDPADEHAIELLKEILQEKLK
ncbi:restriction endonuclease subunit S [Sporosarcina limicola]|uniref:Type I restriction enzyme S subunit n=1 Tax=Sporosarcina limicola TaxID=34101 RepID=A0A927MNT5_9BACL|nr:restriction endonuclease subunit S [Sporosarcina limicola]MBE1554844.1 type I restriction enzyme S subunit [Sporosarcina limicola]